jgi:hypothetical protein
MRKIINIVIFLLKMHEHEWWVHYSKLLLFTVTDRDGICANISQIITGSPEHIKVWHAAGKHGYQAWSSWLQMSFCLIKAADYF